MLNKRASGETGLFATHCRNKGHGSVVNKKKVQDIFSQEMDRREFLKYSGLFLLSIFGLKALLSFLSDDKLVVMNNSNNPRGFGSGKYGS
jgi:hypothetical protein